MTLFIRILRYAKTYRLYLYVAAFSLLALTALSLVGPWLIRDLMSVLEEIPAAGFSMLVYKRILMLSLLLFISFLIKGVFRFLNNYLSHKAAWNLVADMRVRVYEQMQKLSLRWYHDKQTGQLMSRATNDTATLEALIAHVVPDLVSNVLILVGVAALLFIINPTLALFTLIPIPFLGLGGVIFSKRIRPNFRAAQSDLAELNATLQDNISGMKEIQAFNQEQLERDRVKGRAQSYAKSILRALKLSALFHPTIEAVSSMGTVIVVAGGGFLALQGRMSVADIVAFLLYLNLFYQPIATMARITEDLQQSLAGAERVFEILDSESDVQEIAEAVKMPRSSGRVQFQNVSFQYIKDTPVLKNISFTADSGKMIALVGPTGVGKTTIISLLARFYDPAAGSILIDGTDIRNASLSSLRSQISMVLQDVFLFNGTIAENIAYGNKTATPEQIEQASRVARADDFIQKMPEGYNTKIGERGVKLSGGQKQRLAIARAVLRDSPILVLDEATASVDVETEAQIQAAIQELAGSRTIIVIAHRLSTVKQADNILLIEKGKITESGTHQELLELGGSYRRLCEVQFHMVNTDESIHA